MGSIKAIPSDTVLNARALASLGHISVVEYRLYLEVFRAIKHDGPWWWLDSARHPVRLKQGDMKYIMQSHCPWQL